MPFNRETWQAIDTFLDTASDRQLAETQSTLFNLLVESQDRATRADLKIVYRLVIDEQRTRALITASAARPRLQPALA
ncbi:MAG: hypothetical protein VBE63_20130 [Lamprobacter sp.]|uniref:hypothetical protein n=1 Tax=Lamprobacter sp. TaxID=3100796 RepID=UPI002B257090|nr:hypothetical protein [Lamprobacter sp.]MEA3642226.1 hypothetical protein [Lamprobacter sp.]